MIPAAQPSARPDVENKLLDPFYHSVRCCVSGGGSIGKAIGFWFSQRDQSKVIRARIKFCVNVSHQSESGVDRSHAKFGLLRVPNVERDTARAILKSKFRLEGNLEQAAWTFENSAVWLVAGSGFVTQPDAKFLETGNHRFTLWDRFNRFRFFNECEKISTSNDVLAGCKLQSSMEIIRLRRSRRKNPLRQFCSSGAWIERRQLKKRSNTELQHGGASTRISVPALFLKFGTRSDQPLKRQNWTHVAHISVFTKIALALIAPTQLVTIGQG